MNTVLRASARVSQVPQGVLRQTHGFTLLEVLVALTVMAIGSALALSLISGTLGNIRKVQMRTRSIEHAHEVMETALLDRSIQQPTSFSGSYEDGSRWSVRVEDYDMPVPPDVEQRNLLQNMPVKMLSFGVEVFGPDSRSPDCRLHTLKLVNKPAQGPQVGVPQ